MQKKTTLATLAGIFALLLVSSGALAQDASYGWTISNSNTDPFSNTGALSGLTTLYLWYQCAIDTVNGGGMSAAEFAIQTTGNMAHIATIPQNNFLNAGSTTDLLLAVGLCPPGPVIAVNLLISPFGDGAGELCLVDSGLGIRGTVDCGGSPMLYPIWTIGFSSAGGAPSCADPACEVPQSLCRCPSPVVDNTWGGIKSVYR